MKSTYNSRPSSLQDRHAPSSTHTAETPPVQQTLQFRAWVLLPLRLFLSITFIYAGIQKFTDPQFFHKSTPGYIGNQIIAFAHGSPLHALLMQVALPHAQLFGLLIACGEIAIGLGALCGCLFRPAAFFGMLLSGLFFLSASWHVYPYFYGSDIVFFFCWLTLLLNGPLNTGLPSIDAWLMGRLFPQAPTRSQDLPSYALYVLLVGGHEGPSSTVQAPAMQQNTSPSRQRSQYAALRAQEEMRRSFLKGAFAGGVSVLIVGFVGYALHLFGSSAGASSSAGEDLPSSAASTAPAAPGAAQASTATGSSQTIAKVSAVPTNTAVTFTIPSTGDPGVLIHLASGNFVAYDATCTHAGCPVSYDPGSKLLICPCHGAEYDPAQAATVLSGPTDTPLTSVTIHVDSATGAITL